MSTQTTRNIEDSGDRQDACSTLTDRARLRRQIHPVIEPVKGTAPLIDFIASDETLDRYGEIIVASGWRLENYRKNPIVQNAHQYGDILFTIGKALVTEVRGGRLFQRVEFATEVNPMARIAYGLYKGRFLNAVSVGFVPLRWETGGPKSGFQRKFIEQELLEVSAVAIPANPNALQLALRQGAVDRSDLHELAQLLAVLVRRFTPAATSRIEVSREAGRPEEEFRNRTADAKTTFSAQGPAVRAAHWLHLQTLLNEIRETLKTR
jgi:hypothetical protein